MRFHDRCNNCPPSPEGTLCADAHTAENASCAAAADHLPMPAAKGLLAAKRDLRRASTEGAQRGMNFPIRIRSLRTRCRTVLGGNSRLVHAIKWCSAVTIYLNRHATRTTMVMFYPVGSSIVTATIPLSSPALRALANIRRRLFTPIPLSSGSGSVLGPDRANFCCLMFDNVGNDERRGRRATPTHRLAATPE